jgi:hypothetical protein
MDELLDRALKACNLDFLQRNVSRREFPIYLEIAVNNEFGEALLDLF